MATISGASYLTIGIIVSIYSKFVYVRSGSNTEFLNVFFYIGILFVIVGLGKLGFKHIKREQPALKASQQAPPSIHYCANCATPLTKRDAYCHSCGAPKNPPPAMP